MVNVEIQNLTRVEKDVYYMRTGEGNMRVHGSRIVGDIVTKSKKIFQESIDKSVYDLPPSTYARTGALRKGVRSRNFSKGLGAGEIFMDTAIQGANGYFYPATVEHGLKKKPNYKGRHYWARGKALAVIEFRKSMQPYANEIAKKIMNK
jgi:hypothetical protein